MLAEGIMLYLLVVKVFGRAAEKWYYLLILGWGKYNPGLKYFDNAALWSASVLFSYW